jgi:hypothetical protein
VARATEWLCERWGAAAVGRKLSAVGKSACALSPTLTLRRGQGQDGGNGWGTGVATYADEQRIPSTETAFVGSTRSWIGRGKDFAVGGIVWAQRHRLPSVADGRRQPHMHMHIDDPARHHRLRCINNTTCIDFAHGSTQHHDMLPPGNIFHQLHISPQPPKVCPHVRHHRLGLLPRCHLGSLFVSLHPINTPPRRAPHGRRWSSCVGMPPEATDAQRHRAVDIPPTSPRLHVSTL